MIDSLDTVSFDDLFMSFNEAFGNYEVQINQLELKAMLQRRGFVPELSFGAFDDSKLVAFTFNGIGFYRGVKTAYDTGTGTIPSYRAKGLAKRIFAHSIPFLKDAGVQQYLLEVLQHNTGALAVYRKLGFEVTQDFDYFVQNKSELRFSGKKLARAYSIKTVSDPDFEQLRAFWDFEPSWQNSPESVNRSKSTFVFYEAYYNEMLVGYCIFDPSSGDITQLAVHPDHRRCGLASKLVEVANAQNNSDILKVINTPSAYEPMRLFLKTLNMPLSGQQYEMILEL